MKKYDFESYQCLKKSRKITKVPSHICNCCADGER
jgi:hypothetical protein